MAGRGAVSGIAVAEIAAGLILAWSGLQNIPIQTMLRDFASGTVPKAGGATLTVTEPDAEDDSDDSGSTSAASTEGITSTEGFANCIEVGKYLMKSGYSKYGATGVATCVWGESSGSAEAVGSGGAGLIGWTPPSKMTDGGGTCHAAGIGDNSTDEDFRNQLVAIIAYNNANGDVSELNAQTSAVAAADYYSQNFERPKNVDSDVNDAIAKLIEAAL
jgi:Phage tail lysozyme